MEGIGEGTQAVIANMPGGLLYGGIPAADQLMGLGHAFILEVLENRDAEELLELLLKFEGVQPDLPGEFRQGRGCIQVLRKDLLRLVQFFALNGIYLTGFQGGQLPEEPFIGLALFDPSLEGRKPCGDHLSVLQHGTGQAGSNGFYLF